MRGHVCGSSAHCTGDATKIFGDTSQTLLGEETPAIGQRMDSKDINMRSEGVWKVGCDGPLNTNGGLGRVVAWRLQKTAWSLTSLQRGRTSHCREKKAQFPF